jgi:hypothetical protein
MMALLIIFNKLNINGGLIILLLLLFWIIIFFVYLPSWLPVYIIRLLEEDLVFY